MKRGKQILSEKSFGTAGIQERIMEVKGEWKRLEDQAAQHLSHLQEALNFFQFSTETDDVVAWLQDAYRLVSSEDFGHDEYSTQSLLKKHRGVSEAIDKHRLHVVALRKHMVALPLRYREQEVSTSATIKQKKEVSLPMSLLFNKLFVRPSLPVSSSILLSAGDAGSYGRGGAAVHRGC